MLLKEISYELLMILRSGAIVDDERIDLRLLDTIVKQYRAQYIEKNAKKGVPELFSQEYTPDLTLINNGNFKVLETTNEVPRIMSGKYGLLIDEIYSPHVDEYPFTVVNRTHLRYSGNGKFNQGIIFVAYDDNKLIFKSKDYGYELMEDVTVSAIFEDPTSVPGFDEETDDYPVNEDCVNYIKDMFRKNDVKLLLGQFSDEINDASGEIKE
jgi:hypothetical protein